MHDRLLLLMVEMKPKSLKRGSRSEAEQQLELEGIADLCHPAPDRAIEVMHDIHIFSHLT
jgi:hypothetical protein